MKEQTLSTWKRHGKFFACVNNGNNLPIYSIEFRSEKDRQIFINKNKKDFKYIEEI